MHFYITREEQKSSKTANDKVKNWFKKGKNGEKFRTVMFVDATPDDKLLKMLKYTEEKHMINEDFRIKFVSKAGRKLKDLFQCKSMSNKTCEGNNDKPCVNSNGKGIQSHLCKQNRVSYYAKCLSCKDEGRKRVYYGETARNLHARSIEHYNALQNKSKSSFLYKHINKEHRNNPQNVEFDWGVCGKFSKPLYRQLQEAICINNESTDDSLYTKTEYAHLNVNRVKLNSCENKHQCNKRGRFLKSEGELTKHKNDIQTQFQCQ